MWVDGIDTDKNVVAIRWNVFSFGCVQMFCFSCGNCKLRSLCSDCSPWLSFCVACTLSKMLHLLPVVGVGILCSCCIRPKYVCRGSTMGPHNAVGPVRFIVGSTREHQGSSRLIRWQTGNTMKHFASELGDCVGQAL